MAKSVESLRIFLKKSVFFAEKIDWNMTQLIPLCLIGSTTRDFSKSP